MKLITAANKKPVIQSVEQLPDLQSTIVGDIFIIKNNGDCYVAKKDAYKKMERCCWL